MTTVYYIAVLGQSNAASMFNFGNDADSGASVLANSLSADLQPTGPGSASSSALTALVNGTGQTARFATANNVVVQNYALGASGVDGNAYSAPPAELTWWYPDTGTPGALSIAAADGMNQTLTSLRAQYDDVRVIVMWGQGEADAKRIADGYSDVATYKAATMAVFDYVRASVGQADAPVYINEIGVAAYQGSEARWNVGQEIVRAAQDDLAAQYDNVYIGAVTQDLPMKDVVHISDDSYEVVGARAANYIAYTQGLTDVVTGPRPTPDPDIKVDPTDALPTSNPDTVDLALTTTGNLLENDHDPDGDVLSIVQVSGTGSVKAIYTAAATIQGRFGTLLVSRDGSYQYVLDTSLAATRAIAAGQIGTDVFTYVVNDGRGGTASSTLSVQINGQNDAPAASNDVAVAASSVPDPLTGNVINGSGGLNVDSDPDAGDTISVAQIATGASQAPVTPTGGVLLGSYGALTMLPDGTYSYAIDQGNPAVGALLSGQSLTDHFTYAIVDTHGLTASASLDIIVQKYPADIAQFGTPTIVGKETADNLGGTASGDIISGLGGNDTLKGNDGSDVLLGGAGDDSIQGNEGNDTIVGGVGRDILKGSNGADVFFFGALADIGDVIQDLRSVDTINVAQILNLAPGTPGLDAFAFEYLKLEQVGANVLLSIDPDGRAGPADFVTLATLEATTIGAVLSTQFIVSAAGTLPADPSAPTATNDTFVVSEDTPETSIGNVVTGAGADIDPNGAELSVVAVNNGIGLVGSWVTLSTGGRFRVDTNGDVQFDAAGRYQNLAAGQTSIQKFTYSIFNDFSTTAGSTATASIVITGVNDAPTVTGPLSLAVTAGSLPATLSLVTGATDVDLGDILGVVQVSGLGEGLSLSGTTLTVDPTALRFAGLHVGETQTIALGYDIVDLSGAFVHQTASIIVAGSLSVDPKPPVLGAPPTLGVSEGGTPAALDLLVGSSGANGSSITVSNLTGLTSGLEFAGSTVTVDPGAAAFNALAAGELQTVTLHYSVGDGIGAPASQTAVITIEGTNDAPTTSGALTTNATRGNSPISIDLLSGASDVDHGAILGIKDLSTLPAGFSLDGTRVIIDPSNPAFQTLYDGQSVQKTLTFRVADEFGATVDQTLTVTIMGRGAANAYAVTAPTDANTGVNRVAENAIAGTLIGITARATDADATNNAVTYSLVNPSGEFVVDRLTGVVTVAGAIDFEAGPTRSIVVEARSEDGSTARSSFSIAIDNLNEFAPLITTSGSQIVAENTTFVANLTATDADSSGSATSFSITGGVDASLFAISSGKLVFKTAHDYEQDQRNYQVQVTASDGLYTSAKLIAVSLANVTGTSVTGTSRGELIDATHGPAGQPRPTGEEDTLMGLGGNDTLWGLGGNDVLNGGDGADQMNGGAGDDTFRVDNTGDDVRDLSGNGRDTVVTSLGTYTLGANVEVLSYAGSARFAGSGNALANTITGGGADDTLDGKAGADSMSGGSGNDTYYVDDIWDRVVELPGGGSDKVYSTVSLALNAYVETLVLTGTASLTGTGNGGNNSIRGNSASNTIDGGAGRDTLTGGTAADIFVFRAGEANGDVVTDFEGARVRGGDVLRFENFGRGWITQNGSSDFYTIHGDASHAVTETIQIVGVFNLNLIAGSNGDVLFV